MVLKVEKYQNKERIMFLKDYYDKFEKQSGKKSVLRNKSIQSLQYDLESVICNMFDANYRKTITFFPGEKEIFCVVKLINGSYTVAYAIITSNLYYENPTYIINDIIIHNEDDLKPIADGQINIVRNIYYRFVNYIDSVLKNISPDNYSVEYDMIDSKELFEILEDNDYDYDSTDLDDNIKTGNLKMIRSYKKEEEDELRYIRKQR